MSRVLWPLAMLLVVRGAAASDAATPCPTTAPTPDAACTGLAECEYGGNALGFCTTLAFCSSGAWYVMPPEPACSGNSPQCPQTFTRDLSGNAECPLADASDQCLYPEGVCGCPVCITDGGPPLTFPHSYDWQCWAWSDIAPGCSVPRGLLHAPCDVDGQACNWSDCCQSLLGVAAPAYTERCADGEWAPVETQCACGPPSACHFTITTIEAGADATPEPVGAEETEQLVVGGCGCGVAPVGGAAWSAAIALLLLRRRR